MHASLEFLLGLLDVREAACVSQEDFAGPHGEALRLWQQLGFLGEEPGSNPVPSCPHCEEGVPYRIDGRLRCSHCRSRVDPRHLLLWELRREAFLSWLAKEWRLRGSLRRIDGALWQLGTWVAGDIRSECFYVRSGRLSDVGKQRLSAYRNAIVLYGVAAPRSLETFRLPSVSLLELLEFRATLVVSPLDHLFRRRGNVRFDAGSGALWVGDVWLGEIPVGSKEFHFLECLARTIDHFVSYADLKHVVLRQSGSRDGTEEATFCQRLKNRIKKKWVPRIDLLLVTTNKADGYRLRAYAELS